jgi:hypothetical protein
MNIKNGKIVKNIFLKGQEFSILMCDESPK